MSDNQPKKKRKLTSGQKALLTTMKILSVPIFAFIMFMIGMATGYRYGGGAAGEVFEGSTWRNIFLIIFG
ncbi:DNA-directed RNA polymerase subunit beta [Desulfuribacillus alkaliarsenatis]|uniref:DNA-directed RNA polymerase subunit beta n=1 Tax=Desulfuribacillus alkaliarsenatis TaxID=766136 RepID=A0A1E5G1K9_9FIRM|nr:DNA-directed RNA polymerase subunit beta [Desulfuribacillus alkaliarsenatis]OEF96797.1 hypothetical protein BHF68_06960 [Desulfuribacillus alkaliarsenatis]